MHYVTCGQGKLLILLHGFPDFWYVWKLQIRELADCFRVVAPDMRGYNKTEKPEGVENYKLNLLARDILRLIRALGHEKATVIGHDWGGVVAWSLAAFNPEWVEKLVILNAPHPNAYTAGIRLSLKQLQRSWYVFFFQTPSVPERVLSQNNYSFLKHMIRSSFMNKSAITDEDFKLYVEAWSQPGALTAAINYYRANLSPAILFQREPVSFPRISVPTLVIWGEEDGALSKSLVENVDEFVSAPYRVRYLADCGHWVQVEQPKLVNEYICEFLENQ